MLGPYPTGIGIYSQHCAATLEQYFDCTVVSSFYKSSSQSHIQSPENIVIGASQSAAFKRILYLWRGFPKLEGLVYSPTHHGIIGHKQQIITILDLIPIQFKSQHRFQYYYFKYVLPMIMQSSLAVFTISESVKREIVSFYNYPRDKIHVIPCGLDINKYFPSSLEITDSKPYLLVIGAAYYHKNIHELLQIHKLWAKKYNLKIIGARGTYQRYLQDIIRQNCLDNVVEFMSYLSCDELLKTMQGCKALVYPSLCEGFGMPPLEVMACGRPVILSDIPVHKEICNDAPVYITPGKVVTWANAFSSLGDNLYVDDKIANGLKLVTRYTWQKSGEKLIAALLHVEPALVKSIKIP